jgi:hypothetical protein
MYNQIVKRVLDGFTDTENKDERILNGLLKEAIGAAGIQAHCIYLHNTDTRIEGILQKDGVTILTFKYDFERRDFF